MSHSDQFIALASELANNVDDVEIDIKKSSYETVPKDVMIMESKGIEVILSRGEPAKQIQKIARVPVISCRLTMLDLRKNLIDLEPNKECMISGQMFFKPTFKDLCQEIEKIMNIRLTIFYYQSIEELDTILSKAKKCNIDYVLGGYLIYKKSKEIGLKSKELLFSKQTILEIIYGARKIVLENRKIEKQAKWVKSVIEFTKQGVVAINCKGIISNLNKKAQILLGSTDNNLIGQSINQYLPSLKTTIEKRCISQENIVQIKKQKIILDFQPLYMQKEYIGGLISLENVDTIQNLEHKIRKSLSDKGLVAKSNFNSLIGSSLLIKRTIEIAEKFAKNDFNILISGETGTGKELFAQGIHLNSLRNRGPFVAINCAALPQSLLESELFGYEEGAFSGARKGGKLGLFELAHNGTIFLDEINSISLNIQSRLLRALEEKEIMRIGGNKIIPIDVRIIAATNENLISCVADGGFRNDLYYRINELGLNIPSLRRRKSDIPELVRYFLKEYEIKYKIVDPKVEVLINDLINNHYSDYQWPGNVRELSNLVKRCVVLMETLEEQEEFLNYFLEDNFCEPKRRADVITVNRGTLAEMEKEIINTMLKKYDYTKSELANKLDISRSTLWRILKDS